MKVQTELLKDLVAKAVKGAGNNKLIPITSMLALSIEDQKICLQSTDGTNFLYVQKHIDSTDELYAVVNADLFSKLIGKLTTEYVELSLLKDMPVLNVVGNGRYSIELPLDENGSPIVFPDPVERLRETAPDETGSVKNSVIRNMIDAVKPSLATTYENPCYTGYYAEELILATDSYKIAQLREKFFDSPVLLSAEVVDLLGIMTEDIKIGRFGTVYVYKTNDIIVYAPELDGKEDFAVDAILGLLDSEFASACSVRRSEFLAVLDRLSLFISPYDKNAVTLAFTADGLQISSKQSNGVEVLEYTDSDEHEEYTCMVDIEMLAQEAKAVQSDTLTIEYGEANAIKFVDDKLTIVIALLED